MSVLMITHEACLEHKPPTGHPERVERLETAWRVMGKGKYGGVLREEAPRALRGALERVHEKGYVEDMLGDFEAEEGRRCRQLNAETYASEGTSEAALRSAGGVLHGVDRLLDGSDVDRVFSAGRPPGHHAIAGGAMGFCVFNNVAAGAYYAREEKGVGRVAVVDFDVHHGNGTQDMFWEDGDMFYASTHQWPLYPGTGKAEERGVKGNVMNELLDPGVDGEEFRRRMERIYEALDDFGPELLIISAGFDAHEKDPLAQVNLVGEDYGWATRGLVDLAGKWSGGKVLSALEGGYSLEGLADGLEAHLDVLTGVNDE